MPEPSAWRQAERPAARGVTELALIGNSSAIFQ